MLVVSPHLDDAVFSCGQLLASRPGSVVVSVFAGIPHNPGRTTDWDARCGFCNAEEAVLTRRLEDEQALALLHARPVWMEFVDSQYGRSPPLHRLGAALRQTIVELAPTELALPLGLFHSDHLLAHRATVQALRELRGIATFAYEDAPYRSMTGLLQQRLADLDEAGIVASPHVFAPTVADEDCSREKARAVRVYASQLRALGSGSLKDLEQPERYWALELPASRQSVAITR